MDFGKFKIGYFFLLIVITLFMSTLQAQQQFETPIYITTTTYDTDTRITLLANPGVDQQFVKIDTAYRSGLGGFNNLLVDDQIYSIHIEDFDDFNIAVFKTDSVASIVYSGAQGAIKNDYILARYKSYQDFGKKLDLVATPLDSLTKSLDSLTTYWAKQLENYPFSELFKKDEQMFLQSYQAYVQFSKQLLLSGKTNIEDASLGKFPVMDYDKERYFLTIALYKKLSLEYHFKKMMSLESVGKSRRYLRRLDGNILDYAVREKAYMQSIEHHPRAADLYAIAKPRFEPHYARDSRFYRKSKRNGMGASFSYPTANSVSKEAIDLKQLQGKNTYLYIYDINDPQLSANLGKWNAFYAKNTSASTYFSAYCLTAYYNQSLWRSLVLNSSIAGLNVYAKESKAVEFVEDLGIMLLPRVIEIDAQGKVVHPNIDLNFQKTNILQPNSVYRN